MKLDVSKQVIDYSQRNVFQMPQTATTTTGATATCHGTLGKVARSSGNVAAAAEEALVITNRLAAAGDACFATVIAATGGTPGVVSAVTAAGTITITITNVHASVATTAYTVVFLLVKAAI